MKRPLLFVLGMAALVAGVALAASDNREIREARQLFKNTVTFEKVIVEQGAPRGSIAWDFPAMGAGAANCSETAEVTLSPLGATFGDHCDLSTNFGQDGGAGPSIEAAFSCYVSGANKAVGRACAYRADAGTLNLPDAGYFFRIFTK